MISQIYRQLSGTYYVSNTTIDFGAPHYLLPNNTITMYLNNDNRRSARVLSKTANTAVLDYSNAQYDNTLVNVHTAYYSNGCIGPQQPFTFSFTNFPAAVLQASSTNGGNNMIGIEVSTDNINWLNVVNLPITATNNNTAYTLIETPWPYGRINIAYIDNNTSIYVNKAT